MIAMLFVAVCVLSVAAGVWVGQRTKPQPSHRDWCWDNNLAVFTAAGRVRADLWPVDPVPNRMKELWS